MELNINYQSLVISHQPNKGFTLIETLVVIGTLSLLLLIGSNIFLSSITSGSKTEALKEVRQNGEYAAKIIEETIKNSQKLVSCDDESSPPSIIVTGADGKEIKFTSITEDSIIRIASVSGTKNYYLTSNKVTVASFQLDCGVLTSGSPPTVIINFTLSQGLLSGPQEKRASMSFSSTVTMRVPREVRVD